MGTVTERIIQVDFVADNPDGLEVIPSHRIAEYIVTKLFARGMSAKELLRRVSCHWQSAKLTEYLAGLVIASNDADRQSEFLLALLDAAPRYESLDTSSLAHPTFAKLAFLHTDILTDSRHLLFSALAPLVPQDVIDTYWTETVRRYIVQRHWRRAFDEWKRACRGRTVAPFDFDFPHYEHAASLSVAKKLIVELYEGMVKAKLLHPFCNDDLILYSNERKAVRYAIKHDKRCPHRDNISAKIPGLELAKKFLFREASGWQWKERRFETPFIFIEEGAMVLKLAAYFSAAKNRNRRVKFEKALADYNAIRA